MAMWTAPISLLSGPRPRRRYAEDSRPGEPFVKPSRRRRMMPKTDNPESAKKRVNVEELPEKETTATSDEMKNVKGGGTVDAADYVVWRKTGLEKTDGNKIAVDPSDPSGNT